MSGRIAGPGDVTAFVRELETAYAALWPEDSARWIIEHLTSMDVSVEVLSDAAIVMERWHTRLPTPRAVRTSVAEAQARSLQDEESMLLLPSGVVEAVVEPFLEKAYPGEDITWDDHVRKLHAARTDCQSKTCELHQTAEELAEVAQ